MEKAFFFTENRCCSMVVGGFSHARNHSGQSVWLSVHALSALGTLLRKNASQLVIFKISNAKEYDLLREEYSHLVGKEEFDEIYKLAVNAKPYSFLTILPHSQNENTMFLARFDERISVDSDSDS